jgi:hypothetical protein
MTFREMIDVYLALAMRVKSRSFRTSSPRIEQDIRMNWNRSKLAT